MSFILILQFHIICYEVERFLFLIADHFDWTW